VLRSIALDAETLRRRAAALWPKRTIEMSSFVWMKILESAPERYDRGIRMLSGGRIQGVYERIAALAAAPGKRVLDIGCGTGGATLACAARGARVVGVDIDEGMLEAARAKPTAASGNTEFMQLAAAEIADRFAAGSFDAVVSCLAMSEMSRDEQDYTLRAAFSGLVPGGLIVIGDESLPEGGFSRLIFRLSRAPIAAATYLLTQTTTRPVRDLARRVEAAGFSNVTEERLWSGSFLIVQGIKRA